MLDAAGDYLESTVLPPEDERASAGTVIGIVSFGAWAAIGVIYIKAEPGTVSGLEYHCPNAAECPIDFEAHEQVDWDATFKERYDTSSYRLTVGCGGCGPDDAVTEDPIAVQYAAAKLEPFSTTKYYGLTGISKKYNSSGLAPAQCANGHFGLRLVTFPNASTIVWGAVVGLGEEFTTEELASFSLYIVRNHDEWSGLGWTLPLLAVLIPIIDLLAAAATWYSPRTLIPSIVNGPCNARAVVLQTASWAFLVSAAEITVHLVVAQAEAEFDSAFWVALLLIIGLANLVPYVLTIAIWRAWIFYQGCLSSPYWAIPECALGCGLLFFLGSGLIVGPACLILDSLLRITELVPRSLPKMQREDEIAFGSTSEL